jgi:DNA helicase-2/ATP-dependent DNA helicase PcrA
LPDLLDQLNPAQREAVTAEPGPVLVVAGAGSGKTRVLTTRIAWLLRERDCPPAEVLAFTFTNRAARQMRERVDLLCGPGRAPAWIGTFHATGVRILRRDGAALGVDPHFTIYDTEDSLRLLKQILADQSIDPRHVTPTAARSLISQWKNEDRAPEDVRAEAHSYFEELVASVYGGYERGLRACGALDFDDLVLRTVHLLERHEAVRERYARRFRHVLVDEFQDTNPLQLVMIKALASYHGSLFVVGDDDQAIYSWRGACIENMLRFEEYFPGTTVLRLEQNYRSTGKILAAANGVIAHNRRRKGKSLWTSGETGDRLHDVGMLDDEDEAAQIAQIVRQETARGRHRQDVTVLYRTNAQSRLLEDAMRRANLPYQIVGSVQFYERREVRDLLAYLKIIANPQDRISALRIINVPRRRIGEATVQKLIGAAGDLPLEETALRPGLLEGLLNGPTCRRVRGFFGMVRRWREAATGTSVPDLLERIIAEVGYGDHLQADDPTTYRARSENVAELVNAAAGFSEASEGGGLAAFLEQVALLSDQDALDGEEGAVRLMTIHTAKGLEFPVVVIAGCEEDLLPHISGQEDDAALEEERRLFYVALTRAREGVYLLHAQRRRRFGSYEACLPSRFLAEIPPELLEHEGLTGMTAHRPRWRGPATGRPGLGAPDVVPGGEWRQAAAARRAGPSSAPPRRPVDARSFWDEDVSQVEIGFHEGQSVMHPRYGRGVVARVEGSGQDLSLTVDFTSVGRKHLLARFAHLRALD